MERKREQTELEPNAAEQYRQTADAHAQTLKDFWKRFLVSGLFVVAAIIIIFACLAWFVSNNQVKATSASISAAGVRYTLIADGAAPGVYESAASQAGLTAVDAMLVSESSNLNNDGDANHQATNSDVLGPGSYGSLTFTVVPYAKDLRDVQIDLQRWLVTRTGEVLTGGSVTVDENGRASASIAGGSAAEGSTSASTDPNASDATSALQALLSGHILFFQAKGTNPDASDYGYYANPVTDGKLTIPSSAFFAADSTETTESYTVTLYWVWPERFQNIALTGTVNYTQNLFEQSDASAEVQKNGYTEFLADVDANRGKYFTNVDGITLPAQGEIREGMSTANLQACAAAYNQADELLGTNVKFVQVRFDSQELIEASGDADA